MSTVGRLHNPRTGAFWGQLAPVEHAVQVYRDDATLLDSLESFAGSGLRAGESVILIATAGHLHDLEKRLRSGWIDLDRCRWEERYIAVLAQETLDRFMVAGGPDELLFDALLTDMVSRARGKGRKLRAFGEMVGLLWAEGNKNAALRLEYLWSRLQQREKFPLFCGYSRSQLKAESLESDIRSICAAHSRVVPGYV